MLAIIDFRPLSKLGEVDAGKPCPSRYSFSKSMALSESYAFCLMKLAIDWAYGIMQKVFSPELSPVVPEILHETEILSQVRVR